MAKEIFNVNLQLEKIIEIIQKYVQIKIVDVDTCILDNNKKIITLTCMEYYYRMKSYAPLIVICDNLNSTTRVKLIYAKSENSGFSVNKEISLMKSIKQELESFVI